MPKWYGERFFGRSRGATRAKICAWSGASSGATSRHHHARIFEPEPGPHLDRTTFLYIKSINQPGTGYRRSLHTHTYI